MLDKFFRRDPNWGVTEELVRVNEAAAKFDLQAPNPEWKIFRAPTRVRIDSERNNQRRIVIRHRIVCFIILVQLTALFMFWSPALAQKNDLPFPRDGAKKVLENDYFAIWDVTFENGKATGLHRLPLDQVYVFLTDGAVKFTRPDGTWSIEQEKPGSVRYESKGTEESEAGAGEAPLRAMIFQLKDATPPKRTIVPGIPDKLPREGTVKLFETDRVILWDYTWKTGMKSPLHLHYHIDAAVYIVGGKTVVSTDQGPRTNDWKVGQVVGGTEPLKAPHQEAQLEGEPRAISVTLK
jgi:quercetin dioxygenase-like cupin family protein